MLRLTHVLAEASSRSMRSTYTVGTAPPFVTRVTDQRVSPRRTVSPIEGVTRGVT